MSVDNPAYFYTSDSPKSPELTSKKFTFFRRRSSSNHKLISTRSGNYIQTLESTSQRKSNKNRLVDSDSTVTIRKISIAEPGVADQDNFVYGKFRQRLGSCNDSVFYTDKSECTKPLNRSYNSKSNSISSDGRRHSIGSFLLKDRFRSGSFSDEVPKIHAPKVPSARVQHYKYGTTMDDILIVTSKQSEAGLLWVSHLKACFNNITKQRGRQSFNFLHINVDDGITSMEEVQRCLAMKLQIIIICPKLASLPTSLLKSRLCEIVRPEIAIGMFLDFNEKNKIEMEACKNALPSFKKWRKFIIKNDNQTAISKLIGIAIDILGPALRDQPVASIHPNTVTTKNQLDAFTIFPKKVNFGHNKLAVFLVEALQKDDIIKIKIEKLGDIFEVTNIRKKNPFTLQLTIPETYLEMSSMILIKIEKNGIEIGVRPLKCESRLRELEQILKYDQSPIDMLCQSVGIQKTEKSELDMCLVKCFQKNIPPNFNLLDSQNLISSKYSKRTEEYPTLLHFAAFYGLEQLCLQLLECPGGSIAAEIQNCNGKTAASLAEESGHLKISTTLKNYSQMSELATMYQYFKGVSSKETKKQIICLNKDEMSNESSTFTVTNDQTTTDYMQMIGNEKSTNEIVNLNYVNIEPFSNNDILSNELKIVEPTYFDSQECNKNDEFSLECSNRLEDFNSVFLNDPTSDYLIQPSNIPVHQYLINPSNIPYNTRDDINAYSNVDMSETFMKLNFNKKSSNGQSTSNIMDPKVTNSKCLKRQLSDVSNSRVDDELLEIINDFKNNVFTIQEVENLVSSWKNRNDVQQSYKDKQEQLQNMRKEYERIQNEMKEKLKRPTPFDRMKKFFTRRKSIRHGTDNDKACSKTMANGSENQRPASSLSAHSISSVSSGRLSTSSSASLGDSGTHSDNDERKQLFNTSLRNSASCNPMDNYLIPPTPRRVPTPETTPLEEKDMLNFDSNYCIFPSNIPVNINNLTNHVSHDYMNFPGLNTISETKEISSESDLVSLQTIKIPKSDTICKTSQFFNPCTSFKCAAPKVNEIDNTKDEF